MELFESASVSMVRALRPPMSIYQRISCSASQSMPHLQVYVYTMYLIVESDSTLVTPLHGDYLHRMRTVQVLLKVFVVIHVRNREWFDSTGGSATVVSLKSRIVSLQKISRQMHKQCCHARAALYKPALLKKLCTQLICERYSTIQNI